jgi:transposase
VPPERVASVTERKPMECRRCGHALQGEDAEPRRHQVAELPPIEPEVHEYRLHRLCCPRCQALTSGVLPDGVPGTAFGPRLHAAFSLLTGAYRLSKRQVAQLCTGLLGLTASIGMIAKLERITANVLEQPVAELAEQVKTAEAANVDETGWRENGCKAWLWVVVTTVGVVFRIVRSRAGAVAMDLLGEEPKPIVISDRFPGYQWIKLRSRQGCWAHLRRDFRAMIDREGDGAEVGRQLLWQSNKLFESWHKVRDGTIQRSTFLQTVAWLRRMVWPAPQKLVHLKWESLGTLCHGGTHAEATDRRRDYAIASGFRPRPGQGPHGLRRLPEGRHRRDDLLPLAAAS